MERIDLEWSFSTDGPWRLLPPVLMDIDEAVPLIRALFGPKLRLRLSQSTELIELDGRPN